MTSLGRRSLLAIVLACSAAIGRAQSASTSSGPAPDTVTGCLGSVSNGFDFTDKEGNVFHVAGATSGLKRFVNNVVEATGTIDNSGPVHTFTLASVRLKTRIPPPRLRRTFATGRHGLGTETKNTD